MKDKKLYLKIACLIQVIYIIIMFIYYLFFKNYSDEVLAGIFFLTIDFIVVVILYKESLKETVKINRIVISLLGFWLFFESVVSGIFCFIYLISTSKKKTTRLPVVKEEKIKAKTYIKSIILILYFVFIMFITPILNVFNNVSSYFVYFSIIVLIIVFFINEIKKDFVIFKNNFRTYIAFIIKRYLIMMLVMLLVSIPIVLINGGNTSSNQQLINSMFKKLPIITFILSVFYAPISEEIIFRFSLSKFFSNKTLFIIVSGFLFGILHVIDKISSFNDLLFVLQYASLGMCLSKAYFDSKNIFVPISMHFLQNLLSAVLVLLLY